jgi:hypothetical protein
MKMRSRSPAEYDAGSTMSWLVVFVVSSETPGAPTVIGTG